MGEDGLVSPAYEEGTPTVGSLEEGRQAEAVYLRECFPESRQIAFVPIWDASRSRWLSGAFVWDRDGGDHTHILSDNVDMTFLVSFDGCIISEVSRLGALSAEKLKGDFISKVSHELRSPLHGILASVEFLTDTSLDDFQKSLLSNVEDCGVTLLNSLNDILDFSKVNKFANHWKIARRKRGRRQKRPAWKPTERIPSGLTPKDEKLKGERARGSFAEGILSRHKSDAPQALAAPDIPELHQSNKGILKKPRNQKESPESRKPSVFESAKNLPRLLLVDDNPLNMSLFATFAKKKKLPFDTAGDGLIALKAVQNNPPGHYDIIFMGMESSSTVLD
jgi:hypothetical protein